MGVSYDKEVIRRGLLVTMDAGRMAPSLITFQFNPDTMTRALRVSSDGNGGELAEIIQISRPPSESFRIDVEVDAADQTDWVHPTASRMGIHPQLAKLELLSYPPSATVVASAALLAAGTLEVLPPVAPLTLFVWGPRRVLPVRLTEFSVTEEAYDSNLNPIRAKVTLGLRVLSYNDLPLVHPGYHLFLAHQVMKEAMAAVAGDGVGVPGVPISIPTGRR